MLLPEKDGRQTAVTVKQGDKEIVLDQPYAAAKVTPLGPRAYSSSPQEVEAQFGSALAAQPSRAADLHPLFRRGQGRIHRRVEAGRRPDPRRDRASGPCRTCWSSAIRTRSGATQSNDALGQQRAETVRAALIGSGIPAGDIRAISRGKRALAVPTADGVAEPRNRRVEIIVR